MVPGRTRCTLRIRSCGSVFAGDTSKSAWLCADACEGAHPHGRYLRVGRRHVLRFSYGEVE